MATARDRKAEDLMTTDVLTLPEDASVADAVRLMAERTDPCAVVIDGEGRPQGIISERDLLGLAQKDSRGRLTHVLERMLKEEHHLFDTMKELRKSAATQARDVMSKPVRCVETDTSMAEAARIMEDSDYRQLPVVRDERLAGLLRRQDIVRALAQDA